MHLRLALRSPSPSASASASASASGAPRRAGYLAVSLFGVGAVFASAPAAHAQGPAFQSPGMPSRPTLGQTTRFSNESNPALGFVIDSVADWRDGPGGDDGDDGFDFSVRLLEFNAAAYLDPNAWAYVVFVSEDLEAPEVEEAAIEFLGFGDRTSLKVGRFFVDFGKQMQQHIEELRTVERPLVLRTLLGDELGGAGAQVDWWTPLGDKTPLRASLGVFGSLISDEHGDEEGEAGPAAESPGLKDIDELSITARITAMTELTDNQTAQFGVSARIIPEFEFHDEEADVEAQGLSNNVLGADITWGWVDAATSREATVGIEWLMLTGDIAAKTDVTDPDNPVIAVSDDDASGFYAFADVGLNRRNNVGVQYSQVDLPENTALEAREWDLYWTHHFTEFRRLRLGVSHLDDEAPGDDLRVYLQFTAYMGSHSHGWNW